MPEPEAQAGPSSSELVRRLERARRQPSTQLPAGFYDQAVGFLDHAEAEVREEAMRFLAQHCRQRSDAQVLLTMVEADPSPAVRRVAAECLGGIFRNTRNREALEALAAVVRNPQEDGYVRGAAMAAIKRINGY